MNLPPVPSSIDVLLFDLGRVVLDINFDTVMEKWAGHAGCAPADLAGRFVVNDSFRHHETGRIDDAAFFAGEMPGIAPLLAGAAQRLPLYAFSNTNPAHVAHFSKAYAGVLGHF